MATALGRIRRNDANCSGPHYDLKRCAFLFGAVQHVGISLGRINEPKIIPAAIVETICGLFLLWGSIAVLSRVSGHWKVALIGNLVALAGVLLGMAALAAGRGPRTASNDLYHRIMLVLIAAGLLILFFTRAALRRN
jgi:ascorbate-specific PTS system EIIC-type component UlaA